MDAADGECTPTTEQIKDVYHLGLLNAGSDVDIEAALRQFDRWLVAHDAGVAAGSGGISVPAGHSAFIFPIPDEPQDNPEA